MEKFTARPDAIEEAARRLADATREIGEELARLDARSRALAASWSGEAHSAYRVAHHRWQAEYAEITEFLDNSSRVAEEASRNYAETERQNERRWRLG